ncbi:T9SS type A sorting domain-containing protein [Flavobacterium sp. SM15]|uniref:T9SS type A sorting domain-containing protein n=1 Tax=Flavobacterium sp. SM15 TaxID=2908005 RepID=UPI001ED9DF14|nr:T9SS type A sorting domain-containing protein [Flavobacterium sp. SM15]MCG2611733.1 T9SS type A sorting domain-containing protein [Flavobacterium sp. SM15]
MKKIIFTITAMLSVFIASAQSSLTQAEYFWDTDPGQGLATPILATDGSFNSAFEQLSKTGIALPSVGLHVFNVRVKDNVGTWGPVFKSVVSVQTTLGNTDFELSGLTVYPNPVKNTLNFSYSHDITAVTVYNFLGQQVLSKSLQTNESGIDLSELTSGTYYVKVQSQDKAKTIKIIKE